MKEYSIFLGSSIMPPMCYDRHALGNFVRKVNDAFRGQNMELYLLLYMCELEDPTIAPGARAEKQKEYDQQIALRTDLFVNLYAASVGEFTKRELNVAKDALDPENVLIMFRDTREADESVGQLQQELKAEERTYHTYTNVDDVKRALIRWLMSKEPTCPISMDGNMIRIGEETVLR